MMQGDIKSIQAVEAVRSALQRRNAIACAACHNAHTMVFWLCLHITTGQLTTVGPVAKALLHHCSFVS